MHLIFIQRLQDKAWRQKCISNDVGVPSKQIVVGMNRLLGTDDNYV